MSDLTQFVATAGRQFLNNRSRSDALKPLAWLLGIEFFALSVLSVAKVPEWLLVFMTYVIGLSLILYGFAYVFLLFVDRMALRSERHSEVLTAIEQGVLGDSSSGIFDADREAIRGRVIGTQQDAATQIEHRK